MTTNDFRVTYASGKTATFTTSDADVAAFCNSHFGRGIDPGEFGASVAMNGSETVTVSDPVPADPVEPTETKPKKKAKH